MSDSMNNRPFLRYVGGFLIIIVAFSVIAWFVIFYVVGPVPKTPKDEMLIELSKVLAQLVFITLVGATATFLYNQYAKDYDRFKTKLQQENKNRQDLLEALINVRAEVEKARRNYRLIKLQNVKDGYRSTVEQILQARLELSQVWHDILTLQQLYPRNSETIQNGLSGMKIYLDNLIYEYETNAKKIDQLTNEEATQYIAKLPRFGEFITNDGGEAYTKDFLEKNYRNSARLMRQHLLSLNNENISEWTQFLCIYHPFQRRADGLTNKEKSFHPGISKSTSKITCIISMQSWGFQYSAVCRAGFPLENNLPPW